MVTTRPGATEDNSAYVECESVSDSKATRRSPLQEDDKVSESAGLETTPRLDNLPCGSFVNVQIRLNLSRRSLENRRMRCCC
jgi:hypothetical protein